VSEANCIDRSTNAPAAAAALTVTQDPARCYLSRFFKDWADNFETVAAADPLSGEAQDLTALAGDLRFCIDELPRARRIEGPALVGMDQLVEGLPAYVRLGGQLFDQAGDPITPGAPSTPPAIEQTARLRSALVSIEQMAAGDTPDRGVVLARIRILAAVAIKACAGIALAAALLTFGAPAPAQAAVDAGGRPAWRCRGWLVALDPPAYRFECRRAR
jgi:hypothetical protein